MRDDQLTSDSKMDDRVTEEVVPQVDAEPDLRTDEAEAPQDVIDPQDVSELRDEPLVQDEPEVQARWDAAQLRFIDDPQAAAQDARALVSEALTMTTPEPDSMSESATDTEELRLQVARHRVIFEALQAQPTPAR